VLLVQDVALNEILKILNVTSHTAYVMYYNQKSFVLRLFRSAKIRNISFGFGFGFDFDFLTKTLELTNAP